MPTGSPDLDPVCGMTVRPDGPHRFEYEGVTYRFCSERCLSRFREGPQKYLGEQESPPQRDTSGPYTCPMHPQIVSEGPGDCPICGMALEPAAVTMEDGNPELEDMSRRFWLSLCLTAPVFLIAMSEMLPAPWLQPLVPARCTRRSGWNHVVTP